MRHLLCILTLSLATLASASASAVLAPLADIDGTSFIGRTADIQVVSADINVRQLTGAPSASEWWVEVELELRNVSLGPVSSNLAVLDTPEYSEDTEVYVNGMLVRTSAIAPRQDPAIPEHTYAGARLLPVSLPLDGSMVVSIRMQTTGAIDSRGQMFFELPTNALGLFAETVTSGRVQLVANGRLIGFQSTVAAHTVYDEPLNRATWQLRDWEPRIPFRATFVSPWSALLLVAEIEACPDPWRVMRATTGGQMSVLREYVGGFDDASLQFCANLPEILHGRFFESERTREQLGGMTLDRYIPNAHPVAVYRPNPSYHEDMLTDPEAIYSRSLRTISSERQ